MRHQARLQGDADMLRLLLRPRQQGLFRAAR